MKFKKALALLLCLALCLPLASIAVSAEEATSFTVSGAFGDHMVLQREQEVPVWGWSSKTGSTVTVSFKGNTATGKVDDDGNWMATLPSMAADKTGSALTVSMGNEAVTFEDCLVGDIWLVGGQSNAELAVSGTNYKTAYIKGLMNGLVRYFNQKRADGTNHPDAMKTPQKDVIQGKKWKAETFSDVNDFSALGFFFGNALSTQLDVPIGLVMVCSAGSPVSQLMSAEAAAASGYDRYENNIPVSGMYNALMNPFINMSFKGMIYYQGESEAGLAQSNYGKYNEYVNAYVSDLRQKTGYDFPFYYVQLSSHKTDVWPGIGEQRAVQFDGLSVIPNSGMIVSMDVGYRDGDRDWAHPYYKEPLGQRLCSLALARTYKMLEEENVTSPMPLYAYRTDDGIVVRYKNVAQGLQKIGSNPKLLGFKGILVSGSSRALDAEILEKDKVLLKTGSLVCSGVSYGLSLLAFQEYTDDQYVANLGNSASLPAAAFKLTTIYKTEAEAIAATAPTNSPVDATPVPAGNATDIPSAATATAAAGTEQSVPSEGGLSTGTIVAICACGVLAVGAVAAVVLVLVKKSKAAAGKKEASDEKPE